MSLEQAINENTAAVRELIAKLDAKGGEASATEAAGGKRGPGRPAANKPTTPAVTLEMVKAAAEKVRTEKGKPAAVNLIKTFNVEKTIEIDPARYAEFIAAADVLLAKQEPETPTDDDDI